MFAVLKRNNLPFSNFSSFIVIGWLGFFLVIHIAGLSRGTIVGYLPIFCPFKFVTGIPCPGCGMTRAFLAIAEADFILAFHYNPFSIPFFVLTVLSALNVRVTPSEKIKAYFYMASLVVIIVWWVLARLLPAIFA